MNAFRFSQLLLPQRDEIFLQLNKPFAAKISPCIYSLIGCKAPFEVMESAGPIKNA
jgi:hypothetical protein